MRLQVMKPFVKDLGFRDMCIVLKEQRGWRQAREFFEWMKLQIPYSPSVIAYTTLLGIYGQAGKLTLAEETLSEMLDAGVEPDEVAGGCMLEAYARWERYDTLLEFYEAMRQRGLVPSAHVYRTMIVTLYKAERHSDALMLWEDFLVEKLEPNFVLYAIIIHILNKEGRTEDAVHTFKDMRAAGHLPDELLYNTIICALGKLGRCIIWNYCSLHQSRLCRKAVLTSTLPLMRILRLIYVSVAGIKSRKLYILI